MGENKNVPYIVYESVMASMERTIKRLWVTTLVLITLLCASNAAWIWYESQWEEVTTTEISQEAYADGEGTAIVNSGGEVTYGK